MIVKELKVGDTFDDNGQYFKVLSVLDNGDYISKLTEKPEEKSIENPVEIQKEEPTKKEKIYTKTDIKRMSKDDLLVLAKENGIECTEETSGTEIKEALITKLGI